MHKRPRRNRKSAIIRSMVEETKLGVENLIYPIFIEDGNELNRIVEFPVESLVEDFSKILKKLPYKDSYADF